MLGQCVLQPHPALEQGMLLQVHRILGALLMVAWQRCIYPQSDTATTFP